MARARPPFSFGRLARADDFVDREAERVRLARNFEALVNTAIISPRRWGKSSVKSSLVAQVAQAIQAADRQARVCLIDVFNVRDEDGFYAA